MTNNKAETNRYTQTDRFQNPSSENLKCFTRDFFTRYFCSKNVLPGKNPGNWEKLPGKKNYATNALLLTDSVEIEARLIDSCKKVQIEVSLVLQL